MSTSDNFIKKYLGATPTAKKNTVQQSNKTAGSSAADSFINKYNPTVNESYINSFISDWNGYSSRQKAAYDGLNWKSATAFESDEDGSDLMRRAGMIKSYLQQNKNRIGEDSYKSLVSQLDSIEGYHSEISKAFSDAKNYFSQWETEDDYNKYVAYQKDYDEKSKYDIDAGQKEIEALEAELKELKKPAASKTYANDRPYAVGQTSPASGYTTGSTMVNDRPYAAGQQAQVQREADPNDIRARELEKQISQKKQYLNQAKHIQEGITLTGVVDNTDFEASSGYVSTYDDSRWAKLTGKEYDETYEYINNQNGIRDEIEQKHRNYGADNPFDDGESRFKENGYDLLNENEIAIYNYYYAKEGKEKAQEYLDNIQETLNYRKATGMYETMEGNTALELVFGAIAGLDQWESGMKNLFNGEDDYIAQTAYQIASGMVREDLKDDSIPVWYNFKDGKWEDKVLGNSVGQMAYDTITTSANMAPSILVGFLNPTAGSLMMGASAAGGAYQQALNEGFDKDQARGYSILVGASEVVMEKVLGGISAFGGNALGKTLTMNVANADTALKMIAKRLGGSMISEFTEEYLQEVLDPVFQNIALGTDNEVKLFSAEALYSGILGALTAGIMEGPTTIYGEVKNYSTGKQLKAADISAARLAEIGKTFSADSVAYEIAGKVDENTGAYTLGRLFNEIGATLTDQNKADITNALVEKNMGEITAKKNAEILAYVVEGGQLTDRQAAIIEANTALAEVARTVLVDANSTVNQRTKGYNEALMALAKEKTSPKAAQTKVAEAGEGNVPVSDKVDAQKENASEGSSEVDTSPSQVSSITSIKNRTATIKLEDGSEVSVKDADLSPEDGVRIETIAKIDGITAADANAVLGILRASTGASAQMDSLGATEAYKYGFYGFSTEHMTKHGVFANSLTDSQRQAIYEVGQRARQQQIEKNTPKKADGTAKKTGIYFDDGNGNVVPYSETDMKVTEGKRSAGVKAAMVLRKLGIGGDIYFFESYVNGQGKRVYKDKNGVERPAPNGWYEKKDGSIHIDLNAGKNGEGYVLFTMAHELTHFIEQWSPQKYKVLADFLVENYEKGKSMDELVRAKRAKLSKSRGKKVSYAEAYSEVVADSMEAMLADGNVLDKLIELKAKDNSLFMKMKQFFDNLVAKIRNAYKGLTPDSDEGKAVLEMTDSIEKIQQLFAEALVEASENFQSAEKNTTKNGGVQYSFIGRAADGSGIYKTNYPLNTPKSVKQADLIELVQNVWSNKPITLTIVEDGRYVDITAKFNPELKERSDLSKIAFGNRKGRAAEQRMTLDLASDLYQIASEARYRFSKDATPKPNNPAHDGVTKYHYFLTNLVYKGNDGEYIQCHMNIDVKRNAEGDWFYSFAIEKGSVPQTLLAAVTEESATLPKDIIQNPDDVVKNESAEAMDLEVDKKTESVAPAVFMSERTWTESDYVQEREKAAKEIAKAIGVSEKKAEAYIDSVNSIAKMIADDRTRLDYFSSPYRSSFVSNAEYGGSFDFSTLCKKRRLLTGTFTAIQKALPNTALTANEILDIRNRMKKAGLEVSCGLCYVEGSRANMGQFAKEFLKLYKQYYPDAWQPNMADVNTPDGIEWVRINHPECYEQYEYFWNHYGTLKSGDKNLFASQQKPKLYQLHTEYKGEILKVFNGDEKVEEKNLNGGIRLQSFSDFEIVHLIDTMQIIMDMARVGLAGQAYTKVPDFAWALGDTGLKINLSLIAKGVDENGKLIFDDVEGMPIKDAMELRDRYSKNVGTILVAFNDEQLMAAMADDRVDYIIPFHRSQWKKSQYGAMGLPAKTKDYTYMQNEKFIKPQYHEYRGRMVQDKATNYMPNEYWDFSKSGKENAEAYLEMCARNNKRPKFYKLLQNNGDGSYSLKADGSTDGYWKLLIDFKMYDNDGNGSPQMAVKPEFNMTEANRMLNDYKGGHSQFPVAQGIVDEFVNEYKDSHEGVQFSDRDSDGNQLTKEQQEFFKDSKVRDSNGDLLVLYHGTSVFDNIKEFRTRAHNANRAVGLWLSDSHHLGALFASYMGDEYIDRNMKIAEDAEIGNQKKGGVYKLYANLTNPFVVDALVITEENFGGFVFKNYKQPFYHEIPTPEEMKAAGVKAATVSGEEIATFARSHGYDGVIIKNVKEGYGTAVTDVIAFEPNQVKYTDNLTPTSGPDISYSDRDTESVSNRSLLANAFESVAQNDIERNRLQEYKGKIDLIESEEKKLRELREQIKDLSFAKGPKDTKKIRSLQFEANQAANRINTYDKQLLRLEASAPLQNVLNREKEQARKRAEKKGKEALDAYRERAAKTQRELLDKWQESRKRGIDSRNRTAMRHKIKDIVNELNQYLLKGTKDRHVPIGLQKAVAEALNAVNMDTVGAEERIAKLQAELMKAKSPDVIQEISKKIDNIREMGDRLDEKLKRLKTAYDELINSDDPLIANSHDDAVSAHMMKLIVRVGDTPLREMTIDQLQDVYDVYKVVLATIRNANKSFKDNKNKDISTRANQVMAEIDSLGIKRGKRPVFMSWIEKFGWDGLKPVYAMEHIGSQGLIDAYNNVRAGEDTWAQDIVEAREYYLEKFKKYKYDSWDFEKKHKFTSTTEKNFELTLDQIMSLYAYSKRDQAADHLKYGGIVFDPKTEVVEKTKSGIKVKYNVANATAYNISEETLADIIGTLTEDQKGFVDEMQTYLSDVMGAKGNEVSLAMYDVKLFREKHYFPLKSAHQYMAKAKEQAQGDVKIKNSGFSKETKPHAKNPIVLSSFMDVWSNHVNEMSMYHAFVLPMEDFYRIYNYTTPSKDENLPTEGVNASIENAYGSGATEYIEQMLKDLNGGARSDSRTGFINKMMGLFKKGAVFASVSVVVQQPSAIARAAAIVDTKYFIGPKVDHKRHEELWAEVKQYAPVAIIKEMGYFDTNMGKSTQDFIMGQEYSGFSEKMKALVTDSNYRDEVLSKAPALADEIAWCGIWEAVKRETKDKNPGMDVTSEEFLKMVGERFTEVIVKTQVYDSVLSRSAMMRSKDTGMKMATAFMAEPTTSINMVADALMKGKRNGVDGRRYCRKAIGAVIASQIFNAILVSFVYAGRDDDEDETYWEKYIGTLTGEILDGLNPAGYIPFIKDIVSIVQGYDVERSDMAVVSDLWKAWQNLSNDKVSVYRKVEGFAGSIAQIFGLPVKNIMRDVRGIYQTVMSFMDDQKTTKAGIKYAIKGAITGKTATNKEQLYEARVAGDEEHATRVEARYGDTDSADAAVRAAIKDSFMADEIDEATALKQMVLYAGMDASEAHWLMDAWKYRKTVGSDDGYSKYGKFYDAVRTGKDLKAVVKEYTDNGMKISTLSGQITEKFKPEYVKMSASQRASMKGYLVNAFTVCGMEREAAMENIAVWDWEAQGYDGATAAAVRNYNEHCAADNVPKDIYLYIRKFSNNTENDVDENGKSINYSAMKKIMAEIDAQRITAAQKTAIARSLGWSEKNIQKYKTW